MIMLGDREEIEARIAGHFICFGRFAKTVGIGTVRMKIAKPHILDLSLCGRSAKQDANQGVFGNRHLHITPLSNIIAGHRGMAASFARLSVAISVEMRSISCGDNAVHRSGCHCDKVIDRTRTAKYCMNAYGPNMTNYAMRGESI